MINTDKKIVVASFQSLTATSGQGMARLGYGLSKALHKRGQLKYFVVHSKGKFDTPFPSVPVSFLSRYYLFILNKINSLFKFQTHGFRFIQEVLFDYFCAKRIDDSVGIIFSTQPHLKRTFRKAKRIGIKTILLSGTAEDNYMFQLVSEENKTIGTTEIDAYTYTKRNAYYNDAMKYLDISIGFFPTVYDTFKNSSSFKGLAVKMTGHMTPDFKPYPVDNKKPANGKFVVGYLAYTVVLKGLHYLLESWKQFIDENPTADAQLVIGGPINPVMDAYIRKNLANVPNVTYAGKVTDIAGFMQQLDLFVVPSITEGGPMSALEAAHYAIPVLITNNAGSSELIERGDGGGYTIGIRDAKAIKEKISWAYNNRAANAQNGLNAKENLERYSFEGFLEELADYLCNQVDGKE